MTKVAIVKTEKMVLQSAQGKEQVQMIAVVPAPVLAAAALAVILGMIRKMAKHQLGRVRLSSNRTSTAIS